MKIAPKIISISFFLIISLFFFHQLYIGNPFRDEVPPAAILGIFWVIAITGIVLAFRKEKLS